jgi:hypothetical protein
MLLSLFVLLMTLLLQLPLLPGLLFLQPSLLRLIAFSLCPTGPPAPFALVGILSKLIYHNLFQLLLLTLLMAATTATFSGAIPTIRHFLTLLAAGGFFGIASLLLLPTTSNLATVFYSTPILLLTQLPTSPGRTCFHFLTLLSAFLDPSPSLNHLPTLLDVHPPSANSFHFHSGLLSLPSALHAASSRRSYLRPLLLAPVGPVLLGPHEFLLLLLYPVYKVLASATIRVLQH